jgi:TonB family protein
MKYGICSACSASVVSLAFLLLPLPGLVPPAAAQQMEEIVGDKVYTYVEQMPTMPGENNTQSIMAAIQERAVYPEQARRQNLQGRVFVSFVVGADGQVKDLKLVKGIGGGCDEAALAAVSQLPRMTPGKQNGRAVSVRMTAAVSFPAPNTGAPNTGAMQPGTHSGYNRSNADAPTTLDGAPVYAYVEQMPTLAPPYEKARVPAAILKNMVAPAEVRSGKAEGTVQVAFTVDAKGVVRDPKMVQGLCGPCDEAVLAAARQLKFVPGRQNGQPVPVFMRVPLEVVSPEHVYPANMSGMRARYGGPSLYEYLKRNMKVPAVVATEKLQGRLRVEFVVRPDGKVDAVELKNHLCASCDAEALRLVRNFPAWKPARSSADQPIATRQHVDIPMPLPDPSTPFAEPANLDSYATEMPTLLDGSNAFADAILQAVRMPDAVQRENISGRVYAEFIIDANGLIRQPRITRGLCVSCDQAVLEAITRIGPCTPAQQNGQPVALKMRVEVPFTPAATPAKAK